MKCPVCETESEDITEHSFDGKSVRCPSCGDYDIAGSVYVPGNLTKLEAEGRLRALQRARQFAKRGERPMIKSSTL